MGKLKEAAIKDIKSTCPGGIERNVDLSSIGRWRIGGRADQIVRPSLTKELINLRKRFSREGLAHLIVG